MLIVRLVCLWCGQGIDYASLSVNCRPHCNCWSLLSGVCTTLQDKTPLRTINLQKALEVEPFNSGPRDNCIRLAATRDVPAVRQSLLLTTGWFVQIEHSTCMLAVGLNQMIGYGLSNGNWSVHIVV